jgi:Ferritin-like
MIHLRTELMTNLQAGGKAVVLTALQQAIQLEHATIPLYLYTLYSLDRAKNTVIYNTVLSVVMEEMLHLELICNVLNALGGSPEIDSPGFVPTYPGPLPGGVEGDLVLHLAPFSPEQLSAFMTLEEPETVIDFPVAAALAQPLRVTIGQFYSELKRQIGLLGNGAFSPATRNQVSGFLDGDFIVTDVTSTSPAIDTIVQQGEGTKQSPLEAATGTEPAHYYRFAEIHFGKTLMKNPAAGPGDPPDKQFVYGGASIPFDPSGVFPVPKDPSAANYPP